MPQKRSSKRSQKRSASSKRKHVRKTKKGGAVRMPSEYFGVNSGRYHADGSPSLALSQNAYGETAAVSHGVLQNGLVGPNMGPSPDASCTQTGGRVSMPSEYFGNESGQVVSSGDNTAYGKYSPVSMGKTNADGTVGPNLAVHPNSSSTQTGGKSKKSKKSKKSRKSKSKGRKGKKGKKHQKKH